MLFETLAYVVGYQLYRRLRQSFGDPISQDNRWWIIAAAAVGAVLGSKILGCIEQAPEIVHQWRNPAYLISGKSIVGGLVGGWVAVERIKRRLGITVSTGDLFAVPLAVGIAIGRVGCFLAGLPDQTYGIATTRHLQSVLSRPTGNRTVDPIAPQQGADYICRMKTFTPLRRWHWAFFWD
jgi:prolipoprotein diacylglyceryltransferase